MRGAVGYHLTRRIAAWAVPLGSSSHDSGSYWSKPRRSMTNSGTPAGPHAVANSVTPRASPAAALNTDCWLCRGSRPGSSIGRKVGGASVLASEVYLATDTRGGRGGEPQEHRPAGRGREKAAGEGAAGADGPSDLHEGQRWRDQDRQQGEEIRPRTCETAGVRAEGTDPDSHTPSDVIAVDPGDVTGAAPSPAVLPVSGAGDLPGVPAFDDLRGRRVTGQEGVAEHDGQEKRTPGEEREEPYGDQPHSQYDHRL